MGVYLFFRIKLVKIMVLKIRKGLIQMKIGTFCCFDEGGKIAPRECGVFFFFYLL